MNNAGNFSLKLFSSLVAALEADGGPMAASAFMKAALALRAWYRHVALRDRPEMVVQMSASRFEVYGGTAIERQPDGSLKLWFKGEPCTGNYVETAALGQWLARGARQQVQAYYYEEARLLVANQCLNIGTARKLQKVLEAANDYVSFKLNVCWWRRTSTLAADGKVLGKLLWDSGSLDKQVFGLGVRVGGFRFTVLTYNACATCRDELAIRIKEAPHMAPWLLRRGYDFGVVSSHETVWRDMREKFMSLGGTAQAWKWLCGQGHAWFNFFDLDNRDVLVITQLASLQVGKAPFHRSLMLNMRGVLSNGRYDLHARYLDVFKAAVVAFQKRKLKLSEFHSAELIFDYLQHSPAASTKGATWASLMRKQQVWHREHAREEAERRKAFGGCLGWAPYIQTLVQGELEAVSLNSSDELWEEGDAMHHCVGGYDDKCYRNQSRIYSIRRNGERVATLELRVYDGELTIGQLYGCFNRTVKDVQVTKFAKQVLSACKRVSPPNPMENRVIREPKTQAKRSIYPVLEPQQHVQQFALAGEDDLAEIPF